MTRWAYRFFCLQSHYRRNLVFSYENLDNAAGTFQKLVAKIAALQPEDGEAVDEAALAALQAKFRKALDNDLNTSLPSRRSTTPLRPRRALPRSWPPSATLTGS